MGEGMRLEEGMKCEEGRNRRRGEAGRGDEKGGGLRWEERVRWRRDGRIVIACFSEGGAREVLLVGGAKVIRGGGGEELLLKGGVCSSAGRSTEYHLPVTTSNSCKYHLTKVHVQWQGVKGRSGEEGRTRLSSQLPQPLTSRWGV